LDEILLKATQVMSACGALRSGPQYTVAVKEVQAFFATSDCTFKNSYF
jgi:hypothetical protein